MGQILLIKPALSADCRHKIGKQIANGNEYVHDTRKARILIDANIENNKASNGTIYENSKKSREQTKTGTK